MTKPAAFRQADVIRTLKAIAAADLPVSRVVLEPSGNIVIVPGQGEPIRDLPAPNPWDEDLRDAPPT